MYKNKQYQKNLQELYKDILCLENVEDNINYMSPELYKLKNNVDYTSPEL